ncbi:hypothetical protein I302_108789 [Kwoniella bestiolae CBS 10118]|uniref:Rhodanese domain-containing protein n=1 Tax=Kwoniella bestiolae CBS 10118 TaxID=1296100 RepID=A0A1B9FU38_9TREE|nr:hypothetical protein I302_07926 [Kwoniella bestiolae CBS 10118]OCF22281.1 hypothetical protein I302_07926 [Kwoniella bestiolae CBS 10118]
MPPESKISAHLHSVRETIVRLDPKDAHRATQSSSSTFLIDTRPASFREKEGFIPGALIIERNVLEWRLDPTSPDSIDEARRSHFTPIVFCNEGYASTLAVQSLNSLGVKTATDLKGGFRGWKAAGLLVTISDQPKP